jgi:DNA-binding MarR family transcriptional regulator
MAHAMSGDFHPRDFRRSLRGPDITLTEYRVAVELSEYAAVGKPVVWPSIDTLAGDCGLHRSTVIAVLNRLRAKGVIVCDGDRSGGRGRTTRWRLVVKGRPNATVSDGERVVPETERVVLEPLKGRPSATRSSKEEGGRVRVAAPPPPPTSRPTPTLGVGPETDDDEIGPEPSRYCPRHPGGTDEPCGGCRDARLAHEEWVELEREEIAERHAIAACAMCDGEGYRLGPGGEPLTVPKRARGGAILQRPVFCDHRRHDPDCSDCAGTGRLIRGVGSCRCKPGGPPAPFDAQLPRNLAHVRKIPNVDRAPAGHRWDGSLAPACDFVEEVAGTMARPEYDNARNELGQRSESDPASTTTTEKGSA